MTKKLGKPDIVLDTFGKMEVFVKQNTFPNYLSEEEYKKVEEEFALEEQRVGTDDAYYECCLKYSMSVQSVLSDFVPIKTKDNDKRKRKKKISLRILGREGQTKGIIISPGLHEMLGEPDYISFLAKDKVLAIGKDLPQAKKYVIHVGHNGHMIRSKSLAEFLCKYFKLDFNSTANVSQPFKTVFADYSEAVLKMHGDLTTVVFMFMAQ